MAANQTLATNCFMAGLPEDRLYYFLDKKGDLSLTWLQVSKHILRCAKCSQSFPQALLLCGDVQHRYRNLGSAPEAEAEIRAAIEENSWYEPITSIRVSPFLFCLHRDLR
jgi:hypothetical protein